MGGGKEENWGEILGSSFQKRHMYVELSSKFIERMDSLLKNSGSKIDKIKVAKLRDKFVKGVKKIEKDY